MNARLPLLRDFKNDLCHNKALRILFEVAIAISKVTCFFRKSDKGFGFDIKDFYRVNVLANLDTISTNVLNGRCTNRTRNEG